MALKRLIIVLAALLALSPPSALADSRIKTLRYAENRVVALTGHLGFQTVIEFNDDETIENVAIGDSVAWQVTPNRRGDVIILKPISAAPPTNMTVVTSLRQYIFELKSKDAADAKPGDMVFVLRFSYPDAQTADAPAPDTVAPPDKSASPPDPALANRNYSYSGSSEIIPSAVFDDGRSTYFQWPPQAPAPAIFLVNADGDESVVNHGFVGDYVVVDRIAAMFSLRYGDYETMIYNDAYAPPPPGPDAPRPRPKKRGFFGKVFGGGD